MANKDLCRIGSRMRKAREAKHLTQEELAELVDRSAAHIGLIERGERIPSLATSAAAKEVALEGSRTRHEHMRLVNLDTGAIECSHTDELPNQVGGRTLYRYLDVHSENRYAFIHNHNAATELSFPDIELMVNNKQISVVAAVRNDGIITLIESNGKHTSEYLMLRYEDQIKEFAKRNFGYPVPKELHAEYIGKLEIFVRNLVIEEFSKGGLREYGEGTER